MSACPNPVGIGRTVPGAAQWLGLEASVVLASDRQMMMPFKVVSIDTENACPSDNHGWVSMLAPLHCPVRGHRSVFKGIV
jgi:hypothetical protein